MNNIRRAKILGIAAVLLVIAWFIWGIGIAEASDERDDRGDTDIEIDVDSHGGDGGQGGEGGHGGEGGDADANAEGGEASATANGEQNVTFEGSQSPGRGYIGGGSSTADDQKVRAISGGWLTGMASLRWDATDKELRGLRRADNFRERGQIEAADRMECSQKVIYKAVGGSRQACVTMLVEARAKPLNEAAAKEAEHDAEIDLLRLELARLSEAEEEHALLRMEVTRVSQPAAQLRDSGEAARLARLEDLAKQYESDRAAQQDRQQSYKMIAETTLNNIEEAGYGPQDDDEDDDQ